MPLSRRTFLWMAGATSLAAPLRAFAQAPQGTVFQHGVASGDPLSDAVIIWTRVTPARIGPTVNVDVRWRVTTDGPAPAVVKSGVVTTSAARDFTVKVDVTGLSPGRTYLYSFESAGQTSPVGRTRTLSAAPTSARLAVISCANFESGYYNVYAALAERTDLDAVLHLGDYIYEFQAGYYGDPRLDRRPEPLRELVSLADYRRRYAQYRLDPDLQDVHRMHPFILVWDDHELADNAWSGGALGHHPRQGEGNWGIRRAAAARAYREWLPIRDVPGNLFRLYRSFQFGQLATLAMLDTRSARSAQVDGTNIAGLAQPSRRMLGIAQEQWLYETLRKGSQAGTRWALIGQQVMFSPITPPGRFVQLPDAWDGYQAERGRIRDFFASIPNVVILGGDMHSSWAFEVPRDPWSGYRIDTGEGSVAVEFITPAISSAGFFSEAQTRTVVPGLLNALPHLKYLEGMARGYLLLDLTMQRLQASFHYMADVTRRSTTGFAGPSFVVEAGRAHLLRA